MVQANIIIGQMQSRVFARAIYADIISYVKAHQEEYQKFVSESESEETIETESTH